MTRSSYLVGKAFNSFLFASVLTAAASQMGALIDGLMLSRFINAQAMSAINITSPVSQTLYALCILMGTGGTMLAGLAIGNNERDKASGIFSSVASGIVASGVIIGITGLIFMSTLVSLLCPDAALQSYTSQYLRIIIPASPVYMLMIVMQLFVTLDSDPKRVTAAVTVSMVVNLCLDYVFIAVMDWGMTGAAIATVISYLAAILVLLTHFFKKQVLKYRLQIQGRVLSKVAGMGLPFGIATALIAVQILGNNLLTIHYLGSNGIVVLSICLYLLMLSMIVLTGTLESFQPVAAILKGSGDNRGVFLVLRRAYRFLIVSLLVFVAILVLFPDWIGSLFDLKSVEEIRMLEKALPAYAANIVLQCVVYLLIPVYQLYSHKAMALVISFGQPLMPMACYWLLLYLNSTGIGINQWWGFALGQTVIALIIILCALTRKGNHVPVILIPKDNPDMLYDISIAPDMDSMQKSILEIDGWLIKDMLPDDLRIRIELCCEESLKNIIQHSLSKKRGNSAIDLRIAVSSHDVKAVIRDEGIPFNPIEQDPQTGLGLLLVRKTCDSQNYEYIFHQNMLSILWNKEAVPANR